MARGSAADEDVAFLSARELALFARLNRLDRRLAQIRYRKACTSFPDDPDRQRAALLRDVGKGRPTIGQAFLALLVARLAPRSLHRWQLRGDNSFLAQVGRLARHREAGGDLLELAGSSPRVVEFVRARKLR